MTLFGPDGSYWQFKPKSSRDLAMTADDWGRISFVIWRSSIGFRTDWSFAKMRDAAAVHAKPFAAYHWVYPTGKYAAQGQAEAMAKMNPDRTIPVMLDWETESGLYPTIDDCDKVAHAMRALGYRVPLLYTGAWYWSLPQVGSPRLSGRGYDLVLSDYNKNTAAAVLPAYNAWGGDNAGEWRRELGGLSPVICQFGSRVAFGGLNMDMNAFRGTFNDLGRWFRTWGQVSDANSPPAYTPTADQTTFTMIPGGTMFVGFWKFKDSIFVYAVYSGGYKVWLREPNTLSRKVALESLDGKPDAIQTTTDPAMFEAFGPIAGPLPPDVNAYGLPVG